MLRSLSHRWPGIFALIAQFLFGLMIGFGLLLLVVPAIYLAARFGQEVWVFRAAAIVLGVFFTFATLLAYFLCGLFMKETEDRTRSLFKGLCIWAEEIFDKCADVCRDAFGQGSQRNGSH